MKMTARSGELFDREIGELNFISILAYYQDSLNWAWHSLIQASWAIFKDNLYHIHSPFINNSFSGTREMPVQAQHDESNCTSDHQVVELLNSLGATRGFEASYFFCFGLEKGL